MSTTSQICIPLNLDLIKKMTLNGLNYDFFGESMGEIDESFSERDFDFDVDRFGNQRTIYFDSEFIVDRVETIDGKEFVIGIPVSLKDKGYEAKIAPIKIEEIYFSPKK